MTLEESYAFCERVARTQAKNFYYSFLLLSRPQRQAMCATAAVMAPDSAIFRSTSR